MSSDMNRLHLPIEHLARLVGDRPGIDRPWHDTELDRDAVTDGKALLVWDGCDYAPRLDAPAIGALLEPVPAIGETTLDKLLEWVEEERCDDCDGPILPRRCQQCWQTIEPKRLGIFFDRVVDRALLQRYLRPIPSQDTKVVIRTKDGKFEPVKFESDRWSLVIMPCRADPDEAEGPPFR